MLGIEAAIAMILSATPPGAAPAAPEDQMICVGTALIWRGTAEDIRQIARLPVPAHYRELFFQGGCGSGLIHESLIDWHLAFGNEQSTTAALAFLEHAYLDRAPAHSDMPATFVRLSRAARAEARRAAVQPLQAGHDSGHAGRHARATPAADRLSEFSQTFAHLVFLADQTLRAAEYYASPPLREKAQREFDVIQAVLSAARAQNPSLTSASASADNDLDFEEHEIADIEMRLAILKARLSRDPADIDEGAAIVDRNYAPVLRLAAEAPERQDDFCDSGSGDGLDPIRAACGEESYFLDRVVRFWRNQAQLDMIMASDPAHYGEARRTSDTSGSSYMRVERAGDPAQWPMLQSYDYATRILEYQRLERELSGAVLRYRWDSRTSEDIFALYLGQADMYRRLAENAARSSQPANVIASLFFGALSALERAERLAPAAEMPARFRQIAMLYPALAEEEETYRRHASEGRWVGDPARARKVAYFREVLAHLDQISASEFPAR